MCSMLHSEEWSQVYPYWGENWKMTVNNKNVSPQREYFHVCFILYTMPCVWLIIDNFDNIRTNTTDQSQLTVGLWPVSKPVGTPRNTCSAQLFQKGANPLLNAGLSMPIFDISPQGLQSIFINWKRNLNFLSSQSSKVLSKFLGKENKRQRNSVNRGDRSLLM